MSPADLELRASALYGEDWQSPLARRVRVDTRTVRRWKSGERAVPDWLEWAIGVLERNEGER